ncbi:MAG: hypothetical protein OXH92_17925 [Bryobacterales bacterium]|nr:hypothetical protein [Bryobacterales bacterium]MDE0292735.1 hypothetical protein [Bryobacterales bacterium]MDE0435883.1 hypothetical protein [Bryobacterales bacterium]
MQKQATLWIRTAIIMAALVLCASGAFGEEKQTPESDWASKMIKLEHINPSSVYDLFRRLPGNLQTDSELGLMVVYGPPSTLEFVEEAVKQLDVPSVRPAQSKNRNVEITAWLVGAGRAGDSGSDVAPLLRPVIGQLQERFPYQGYRLLETTTLRLRSRTRSREPSRISGLIPDLAVEGASPASYEFSVYLNAIQSTSSGHTISADYVWLEAKIPVRTSAGSLNYSQIQIQTQMALPAGKTVVVGKAGVQGVVDGIFLVLQANIVD